MGGWRLAIKCSAVVSRQVVVLVGLHGWACGGLLAYARRNACRLFVCVCVCAELKSMHIMLFRGPCSVLRLSKVRQPWFETGHVVWRLSARWYSHWLCHAASMCFCYLQLDILQCCHFASPVMRVTQGALAVLATGGWFFIVVYTCRPIVDYTCKPRHNPLSLQ